jgi:hypothetical protein
MRLLPGVVLLQALAQLVGTVADRRIVREVDVFAAAKHLGGDLVLIQMLGPSSQLHFTNVTQEGAELGGAGKRGASEHRVQRFSLFVFGNRRFGGDHFPFSGL